MRESFTSPEPEKEISKDEVIMAYRKFVEQGITTPDDLDLEDPQVQVANLLFNKWRAQEDAKAADDIELQIRSRIAETMFYVDAGFTDPDYLDEVLKEWLLEDAQDAEMKKDDPRRAETRQYLADAIKKVRKLLELSK